MEKERQHITNPNPDTARYRWILYAERRSPRLEYVCYVIRQVMPHLDIQLTTSWADYDGVIFSYGVHKPGAQYIPDSALLWQTGHTSYTIDLPDPDAQSFFENNTCSFDLFSAIFYITTRYAEYSKQKDAHGRFLSSFLSDVEQEYISTPVIHKWIKIIYTDLDLSWTPLEHSLELSCDIDFPLKYKNKGFLKNMIATISGDPYDTYNIFNTLAQKYNADLMYFIPAGLEKNEYDLSPPLTDRSVIEVLEKIRHIPIGLHPSHASSIHPEKIKEEKVALQSAVGRALNRSRMHYLHMELSETYRALIDAGLFADYTMGYADCPGWRNGLAVPIRWYDVDTDHTTDLMVHPLIVMDMTLNKYQDATPETAIVTIDRLKTEHKMYGGCWHVLWHNSSFDRRAGWDGWRVVLEHMLSF